MGRVLAGAVLLGALIVPHGSGAIHGGCLVHTAQTTCTYVSVGSHSATGVSLGPWEVTVVRSGRTVVVGGGAGGGPFAISAVGANAGESATIEILPRPGDPVPIGVISVGNTADHI